MKLIEDEKDRLNSLNTSLQSQIENVYFYYIINNYYLA